MLSQDNNNSYSNNGLNNIREEKNYPFTSPFFLDNKNGNNLNKNNELIFNADFESGNLDSVQKYSYCEYDLYIRPDPSANNNKQGHRVWFYFQIKNTEKNQRVILNIVNFSKAKMALYRQGATPVVKSDKRPEWVRLPKDTVFLHRSNRHKKNYVLSIAFCFDDPDDTYYFAFSFPYTYTQLQNYLKNLEERNLPFLKRSFIGYSVEKKRLDLLTISNIENFNKPGKKKTVCITSRVHPGESPSSYVCEGLINFLVSNDPIAKILRDNLIFKIIPCLNPDGVYHGNYRTCTLGYDLNRNWLNPQVDIHPTIYYAKTLILAFKEKQDIDLNIYIDIHAHSTLMNGFIYGNVPDDDENKYNSTLSTISFPSLFHTKAKDFSLNNTIYNKDPVKAGTGRRTLGEILDDNSNCYTLEVSFFFQTDPETNECVPYTIEKCKII